MSELTRDRVKQYEDLLEAVEGAKKKANEATGAFNQLKKRLLDEFGCKTVKQAQKKIRELEDEKEDADNEFENAMDSFEKEWEGKTG